MAKNKSPMFDDDHIPEIMTEQPNPWKSSKGYNGTVNFDGNQNNGKGGSPYIPFIDQTTDVVKKGLHDYQTHEPKSEKDGHGGVNWDNTQGDDVEDQAWEKQQGTYMKAEGKFKDITNGFEYQEVDLSKKIHCVGMPDESISGNSSDCGYGG